MIYATCHLSVVPMRSDPSHRSEMVNQMLFGEVCCIVETHKEWSKIELAHDNYQGWLLTSQLRSLEETDYQHVAKGSPAIAAESVDLLEHDQKATLARIVTAGSFLPYYNADKKSCRLGDSNYTYTGQISQKAETRNDVILHAYLYMNAPYLWGGRTLFGLDCSGFTQMVYRLSGFSIPRDASQQARQGEILSFLEEAQPGDLAFFDNEEGQITHVGLLVHADKIIHCSGQVRVDSIDQSGIYNHDLGKHTHRLRILTRILSL